MSEFNAGCEIPLAKVSGRQHKIFRTFQGGDGQCKAIVGMLHELVDYQNQALCAKHPVDDARAAAPRIKTDAERIFSSTPSTVAAHKVRAVRELVNMIHDNEKSDKIIIDEMPEHQRLIMNTKKLFTLQQLSRQINFPHVQAVIDAISRFHLTGLAPYTHYFTESLVVPVATKEQVLRSADCNT